MESELDALKRKITELETEKETYVYQIGEVRKQSKRDMERAEKDLAETREKNYEMSEKLSRVEQIEDAIIKLFLEVKDRSADVVRENDKDLRIIEEKQLRIELKKQSPLVVLDDLKAHLRTLLAFKDDYENELRDQMARRHTETEKQLEKLKKKMEELEEEKENYKTNALKAIENQNLAVNAKREIIDESNSTILYMKKDNSEMLEVLKGKEKEIDKLHSQLDKRDEILRHREIQMMKITQLESRIQKNKIKHQFDLNRLKSEHYTKVNQYEKELAFYNKVKAEKKDMEQDLENATKMLSSFKGDTNRSKMMDLEEREAKAKRKYDEIVTEVKQLRSELNRAKTQNINLRKENVQMKQEYQKIFNAALKEKQKRTAQEDAAIKEQIEKHFHEHAERNPNLASFYKNKLKEKEKECVELTKRVRRMILAEHRTGALEKNFEEERSRLQSELSLLKKNGNQYGNSKSAVNLFDAEEAEDSKQDLKRRNQALEEQLRDLENYRSLSNAQLA
jgi:hypothetical protein